MSENAELYKALSAAQKQAEAVEKDATNSFHKYKYASAEAIIAEARAALTAHGLAVFPVFVGRDPEQPTHVWVGEGDDAAIDVHRRILAIYRLTHESGESIEFRSTCPVIPEKGRPEDKAEFGARTENLGYALRDLLCLPRVAESAPAPSGRDDSAYNGPRRAAPAQPAPAQGRQGDTQRVPPPSGSTVAGSIPPKNAPAKTEAQQLAGLIDDAARHGAMDALVGLVPRITKLPEGDEKRGLGLAYRAAQDDIRAQEKARSQEHGA